MRENQSGPNLVPAALSPRAGHRDRPPKACGLEQRCQSTSVLCLVTGVRPSGSPLVAVGTCGQVAAGAEGESSRAGARCTSDETSSGGRQAGSCHGLGPLSQGRGQTHLSWAIECRLHSEETTVPTLEDPTGHSAPASWGKNQGPELPQGCPSRQRTGHFPRTQATPHHLFSQTSHPVRAWSRLHLPDTPGCAPPPCLECSSSPD